MLQAVCELLTVAGKTLEAASAQSKQRTASYFAELDKYMNSKVLPSRTRFMVRDLVELRRSNWIPRRAQLQVSPPCKPVLGFSTAPTEKVHLLEHCTTAGKGAKWDGKGGEGGGKTRGAAEGAALGCDLIPA